MLSIGFGYGMYLEEKQKIHEAHLVGCVNEM